MKKNILILGVLFLVSSCASKHTFMRGSVVMKLNKTHANICMGINELKVNDKVSFEKHSCKRFGSSNTDSDFVCRKIILGEGTVTKLLNTHYSQITTDGDFDFKEGTLVVKK